MLLSPQIRTAVEREISDYASSRLNSFVRDGGAYAIKFVQSQWAAHYSTPRPLKVSETPALTWGTATYVTPLVFPLSSALYGRIGVVAEFDPEKWRIFDATTPASRFAYIQWARSQPVYSDLLLTVHSTQANHFLRNQFRELFRIDCVLFHPDQEADLHTNKAQHVWMAVTDWTSSEKIETQFSNRFQAARFTVLLDEDFRLQDQGLPIRIAERQIEKVTQAIPQHECEPVDVARVDSLLPSRIAAVFHSNAYMHVYIVP